MQQSHRAILESAIAKYTAMHQIRYAQAEMHELLLAIDQLLQGRPGAESKIVEEIADVQIMLWQLQMIYPRWSDGLSAKMGKLRKHVEGDSGTIT